MIRELFIFFGMVLLLIGCEGSKNGKNQKADVRPNVVFILSDDQAWNDYSFMEHPHIQTPHIDRLAGEGLTFTRGYVTAPVCSPSLASIITGLYPHQNGVTGNDPAFELEGQRWSESWNKKRSELNREFIEEFRTHPSLTDLLDQAGYVSFQAGKWWEGSWQDGGFSDGMTHGDPERGARHGDAGLDIGRKGMQPVFDFIDKAEKDEQPFFLWYAPLMPHTPHTPPDSLLQKYLPHTQSEAVAKYWAMTEWFDYTVGQLLERLEKKGLCENTLVVYVCDNGWIQNPDQGPGNKFMPRSKLSAYEMGIRTPIIYKWPGHIKPKMDTSTFVSSIDMVPTVLHALGLEKKPEMQGINVLNEEALEARETIYSENFAHDMIDPDRPEASLIQRVVLKSPWKLIQPYEPNLRDSSFQEFYPFNFELPDTRPELYNVITDPHEENNVASDHPELVRELQQQLDEWWNPAQ